MTPQSEPRQRKWAARVCELGGDLRDAGNPRCHVHPYLCGNDPFVCNDAAHFCKCETFEVEETQADA